MEHDFNMIKGSLSPNPSPVGRGVESSVSLSSIYSPPYGGGVGGEALSPLSNNKILVWFCQTKENK